MIHFTFSLSNPFSNRFSSVYEKSGKTWMPHKYWDLTVCKNNVIIGFSFHLAMRQDHARFGFHFDLLGWGVEFIFYDYRHWNDEKNCWENEE